MFITNALRDEIGELNKSKGWHDEGKRSIAQHCILLHSEVSEIVEDYRSNYAIDYVFYEHNDFAEPYVSLNKSEHGVLGKPCGIPSELADVVIRALDMAYEYEYDINLNIGNFESVGNPSFEETLADLHYSISQLFMEEDLEWLHNVIYICKHAAEHYNINLEQQIRDKIEYNRTRPIKHGGKRL